jgi:hypothetical protein
VQGRMGDRAQQRGADPEVGDRRGSIFAGGSDSRRTTYSSGDDGRGFGSAVAAHQIARLRERSPSGIGRRSGYRFAVPTPPALVRMGDSGARAVHRLRSALGTATRRSTACTPA